MLIWNFTAGSIFPDFHHALRSQYSHDEWNSHDLIIGKHHLPPDTIKITKTVAVKIPYPQYIPVPHGVPYPVPVHVSKPIPVEVPKIITVKEEVPVPYPVHQEISQHSVGYEEQQQLPLQEQEHEQVQEDWQPSSGNLELSHE